MACQICRTCILGNDAEVQVIRVICLYCQIEISVVILAVSALSLLNIKRAGSRFWPETHGER